MKRPYVPRNIPFRGNRDLTKDFTDGQSKGIGLVSLSYNYAVRSLDRVLAEVLNLQGEMAVQVPNRFNGPDSKVVVIKNASKSLKFPAERHQYVCHLLGELGVWRKYRNAVIHSTLLDKENSIGFVIEGKVQRTEVLLTEDALKAAYTRLDIISRELMKVMLMFRLAHRLKKLRAGDADRTRYEGHFQDQYALALHLRSQRVALSKLPEFPDLPLARDSRLGTVARLRRIISHGTSFFVGTNSRFITRSFR